MQPAENQNILNKPSQLKQLERTKIDFKKLLVENLGPKKVNAS